MASSHRRRATTVALVIGALLGPSVAAAQDDPDVVREEIDQADQELAAAQRRLDEARQRLEELDAAANELAADLAVTRAQLGAARAAAGTATLLARDAAEQVLDDGAVRAGRVAAQTAQDELADRAVWLWKHGPGAALALQFELAGRARTSHDLALGRRIVQEAVASSTTAAVEAERRLEQVVADRDVTERDELRLEAFDATQSAAAVEVLERRQRSLATDLQELHLQQASIVDALSRDRDAMAALASQLRRTLARVSLDGALVPPADLPLDGPPPPWVSRLPQAGQDWAVAVEAIAVRHGVDGALFTALVWSESGFHAAAVSPAGAIGLAQLMPGTAAGLGVDPWNPYENLAGGARYLQAQIQRFGRADLGLAAYNAGPGRVLEAGNEVPQIAETQLYVVRVLERWELLRSAA